MVIAARLLERGVAKHLPPMTFKKQIFPQSLLTSLKDCAFQILFYTAVVCTSNVQYTAPGRPTTKMATIATENIV